MAASTVLRLVQCWFYTAIGCCMLLSCLALGMVQYTTAQRSAVKQSTVEYNAPQCSAAG